MIGTKKKVQLAVMLFTIAITLIGLSRACTAIVDNAREENEEERIHKIKVSECIHGLTDHQHQWLEKCALKNSLYFCKEDAYQLFCEEQRLYGEMGQ